MKVRTRAPLQETTTPARLALPRDRVAALAALSVVASVLLAVAGGLIAAALALALGAGLVAWARRSSRTSFLPWLIAFSYAAHVIVLASAYLVLAELGHPGGSITGDDRAYFDLASRLAAHLHGQDVAINWSAEAYLINNYFVQLEAAVFFLIGPNGPVMEVMNVAFLHAAAILVWDLTSLRFGAIPAKVSALGVLLYPSLTVWSVLNLKDTLALLLALTVLWALTRYTVERGARWLVVAVATLVVLAGVRLYVFLLLALLVPLGVAVDGVVNHRFRRILPQLALTTAACGALMAVSGSGFLGLNLFRFETLASIEEERAFLGAGTRTAIDPGFRPVVAKPGDRFVVVQGATSSASPPANTAATPTARVFVVDPSTRIVLEGSPEAAQVHDQAGHQTVVVRPNDIVVVSGAAPSTSAPKALSLGGEREPAIELRTDDSLAPNALVGRTLTYVPIGLAYALLAPFPWAIATGSDAAAMGDMLVWYAVVLCAALTVWRQRADIARQPLLLLYPLGILAILSLVEGNVGTLFRHRAMAIPAVIVLASPTLSRWPLLRRLGGE